MTSRTKLLLALSLVTGGCLPGPELLEGTITARLVVTGARPGDVLEATAGARTLRQTVTAAGPATIAFALAPGEHEGLLELMRGPLALCGPFHFSVPEEGQADFSVDVEELEPCDAPPVPDAGPEVQPLDIFSRFVETIVTPNDCNNDVCGPITTVRANGEVEVVQQQGTQRGRIDAEVLAGFIDEVMAPEISQLFVEGCEGPPVMVGVTLTRERFRIADPTSGSDAVEVIEETVDVSSCDLGLVQRLRGRLEGMRSGLGPPEDE